MPCSSVPLGEQRAAMLVRSSLNPIGNLQSRRGNSTWDSLLGTSLDWDAHT